MMVFRTKLKELRKQEELTQDELAERSGISRDTVKRLEGDKYKNPPYPAVYQIARFFKMPVEEIFWYEDM